MFKVNVLRRYEVSSRFKLVTYLTSFIVGVSLFILFEVLLGANPYEVVDRLFVRPLTSYDDLRVSIRYAVPIGIIASGLLIVYRTGIYSIGAEGQMAVGAVFTAWAAYTLSLGSPTSVVVALLVGVLGGIIWGLLPATLKALLNVNEVLTTLMMNFIAYSLVDYLIYGPWRSPKSYGFPLTEPIPTVFTIPTYDGVPVINFLIFTLVVFLTYVVTKMSKLGFQIRAYGLNPSAAYASGMSFFKVVLLSFMISGALAGLAGALQLLSIHHRLGPKSWSVTEGLGYTAIVAAWISRLEPLAVIPVSLLMGALVNGGLAIKAVLGQSEGVVNLMNGMILLSIVAAEFFINYRLVIRFR